MKLIHFVLLLLFVSLNSTSGLCQDSRVSRIDVYIEPRMVMILIPGECSANANELRVTAPVKIKITERNIINEFVPLLDGSKYRQVEKKPSYFFCRVVIDFMKGEHLANSIHINSTYSCVEFDNKYLSYYYPSEELLDLLEKYFPNFVFIR